MRRRDPGAPTGLGVVTAGAPLAGRLHQVARTDVTTAIAVQSTATAVGFTVLAYSLYAEGPTPEDGRDERRYSTYSE